MNIRELFLHNQNINHRTAAYLNVIAHCKNGRFVDLVNANKYCYDEGDKYLLDAEIESWYLCHDQHDIDTIELHIKLK